MSLGTENYESPDWDRQGTCYIISQLASVPQAARTCSGSHPASVALAYPYRLEKLILQVSYAD
jgi:hypothetical protein